MANDTKSSSTNLALILGVGNTAAIICSFVYVYRTMTSMQAQLTRLSDIVSTTILTVDGMKGESSKTKEVDQILASLDAEVREISADLQQVFANNDQQLIKAQMFAIMDALKESGIEPQVLLQRYPQQFQYPGGYNQMSGMMPGMQQHTMNSGMMPGMSQHGMQPGMDNSHNHMHNHNTGVPNMGGQQPNMHGQQLPAHFYNPNMTQGQGSGYPNSGQSILQQQSHIGPLGRTVSGTAMPNNPPVGRGRGRGRSVAQAPITEEEPVPANIDREAVLRQMSSGSGRGNC